MNACFTWKFMTRYATYFFIATPPPCFFALLRIPLTPNETQKWPTDFNGSRERACSRIGFFFPPFFELCSSRSIKINFERLHVACSVSWYSLWSMTIRAIKIPSIPFFFSLSLSLSRRGTTDTERSLFSLKRFLIECLGRNYLAARHVPRFLFAPAYF